MRHLTTLPLWLVIIALMGCQSDNTPPADAIEPVQCGSVVNMQRVGNVYTAGKVTAEDYPLIKDLGVKTIINLRRDEETPDIDEAAILDELGVGYIHVPWNGPDQLTDAKFDAMRDALREADRPLLIHCGSANRVGAGWLVFRVLDEGVATDVALAEAKTIGMSTPAYETKALAYIEAHR